MTRTLSQPRAHASVPLASASDGVAGAGLTPEGAQRVRRFPSVAYYSWKALFLMVWHEAPTLPVVDVINRDLLEHMGRMPAGVVVLSVVERGSDPPDAESLKHVREFFARHGTGIRGLALLIDGAGFVAMAVLGAAMAMIAAKRESFPQRVCRTLAEAAEFLVSRPAFEGTATREDLERVVADARVDARRPWPAP